MTELKTASPLSPPVEALDSQSRLKAVIKAIYSSGSDARQQKNGAHEKLFSLISESKHSVCTCGLDAVLPRHLQTFVDTKRFPEEPAYKGKTAEDGIREVAALILKYHKDKNPSMYIKISSTGFSYLRKILDKEVIKLDEYRKHFNLWGNRGVITYQEKSKNRPGKQGK